MKFINTITSFGFIAVAIAQTTTPSSSQVTKFESDTNSYLTSLEVNPSFTSLLSAVGTALPEGLIDEADPVGWLASIFNVNEGTGIPLAALSGTPTITSQAWQSDLDPSLQTEVAQALTSIALAEQSIARVDLNMKGAASSSSPNRLGWMLGAAAGAVGAAALML